MERKMCVLMVKNGKEGYVKKVLEGRVKERKLENLIFEISIMKECKGYLIVDMYDSDVLGDVFRGINDCFGFLVGEAGKGKYMKLSL